MTLSISEVQLLGALSHITPNEEVARRSMKWMDRMYQDIQFAGKRVLDVGGGLGVHSYYAVSKGAAEAICLEPDDAGAQVDFTTASLRFMEAIGSHDRVEIARQRLQEFEPRSEKFDIVILHNSINHMDEDACEKLPGDTVARATYTHVFAKIASVMEHNGLVIIADCSNRNFFAGIGIRNPFAPTIEWSKHQPPEVWLPLMKSAGFVDASINWLVPIRLGNAAQMLLGHRTGTYFLSSYFRITARRM